MLLLYCLSGFTIEVGAQTWPADSSGTTQNLNGVTEQGLRFYAVGTAGTIRTAGDGLPLTAKASATSFTQGTWSSQTSGTTMTLDAIFCSTSACYASGINGILLKTTNSGTTWTPLTSNVSAPLLAGLFVTSNVGFVVGNGGYLIKTTNGGSAWTTYLPNVTGTFQNLYSVYFTDTATGYAAGVGGVLIKTTNGGGAWVSQVSGTTQTLYSISFINASTGYAVGGSGTMIKTTNGGGTWISQASGTNRILRSISFASATIGVAVGDTGVILWTSNGGSTWMQENGNTTRNLYSVYASPYTIVAVGVGGIILEKDLATGAVIPRKFGHKQILSASAMFDLQGRHVSTLGGFSVLEFQANGSHQLFPILQTSGVTP